MGVRGRFLLYGYTLGVVIAFVSGLIVGEAQPSRSVALVLVLCSVLPAVVCTAAGLLVLGSRRPLDPAIEARGFWGAGWLVWAAWWALTSLYFWVYRDAQSVTDGPLWALYLPVLSLILVLAVSWLDGRSAPTLDRFHLPRRNASDPVSRGGNTAG